MRPSDLVLYRLPVGWRWLVESVWKLEHAFERAKAKDKAEDDTRIRIFFVLAMFAAGFFTLALGAIVSLLPATPLYALLIRAYERQAALQAVTVAALVLVYVLAIARAVTVPFQPFIYFRF